MVTSPKKNGGIARPKNKGTARHLQGSDIAWEALRRWLRQPGASPAQLIALAKHFAGAEPALRNALEVLL